MQKKVFTKSFILAMAFFMCINCIDTKAAPNSNLKVPYVTAKHAVAIDARSGRVLYEKDSHLITPMASTTKIITALVALKYGDLDKKAVISSKAAAIRGSVVGYKKGEEITIRELLHGLMLRSGNDAAIAIAEAISGSVDQFSKLMNECASEIGLLDTHFESPHGLDSSHHYTTAYDLAVATAKAKEYKEFNEIVAAKDVDKKVSGFTRSFHNINKILWQIPEATGVKTGFTGQAGKCLVTSVNHGGNEVIIVVINCSQRWRETKKINEYVQRQYQYKKVMSKDDLIKSVPVIKGDRLLNIKCKEDIYIPVKINSNIDVKISTPKNTEAPIKSGYRFGNINVYEDEKLIFTTPLYTANTVERVRGLRKFFHIF